MKAIIERKDNCKILLVSGDGDYKKLVDYLIGKHRFAKLFNGYAEGEAVVTSTPTVIETFVEEESQKSTEEVQGATVEDLPTNTLTVSPTNSPTPTTKPKNKIKAGSMSEVILLTNCWVWRS